REFAMAVVEASTAARIREKEFASIARVSHGTDELTIAWADGRRSRFAAIWLLDNRPDGRHSPEGQRLFDVSELPDEPTIAAAERAGCDLRVEFAPGGMTAVYAADWLRRHALDAASRAERRATRPVWDKSLASNLPSKRYAEVAQGGGALA